MPAIAVRLLGEVSSARTFGWILFVVYGLTFVYGLVAANNEDLNFLNINGADNGLHLVSALAGLAITIRTQQWWLIAAPGFMVALIGSGLMLIGERLDDRTY